MELSRRDFLKYGALGLGAAALMPNTAAGASWNKPRFMLVGEKAGVSIYKEPDESSVILYQRQYMDIINVYEEVVGPNGPAWNPTWYRCWGGFVFGGLLYEVKYELNAPSKPKRSTGQLAEITVPYTRSLFHQPGVGWVPLWMYFYRSAHWVVDVIQGPDKQPWYKLQDELGRTETIVNAEHMRFVADEEFAPISPEVPAGEKSIDVSLPLQRLQAFEGDNLVKEFKVSTGFPTGEGLYAIKTKMPSKHMGNAVLTSNVRERIWMGVPWTCFFEMEIGLATHGTFWHTNFGTPMSAGCINMANDEAKWIYRWTLPQAEPEEWVKHGWGTYIRVHK